MKAQIRTSDNGPLYLYVEAEDEAEEQLMKAFRHQCGIGTDKSKEAFAKGENMEPGIIKIKKVTSKSVSIF